MVEHQTFNLGNAGSNPVLNAKQWPSGGMVYTLVLETSAFGIEGSNPSSATN